jgi:indole-3-glycerol phosphate synthase
MADILQRILAVKAQEISAAQARVPLAQMQAAARAAQPLRDFVKKSQPQQGCAARAVRPGGDCQHL